MKTNQIAAAVVVSIVVSNAVIALATPIYHLTPLGFLPGQTHSWAYGINGNGDVVGVSDYDHAFLWTKDGGMRDFLGAPGGSFSFAYAINDSGAIAGKAAGAFTGSGSNGYGAFLWTPSGGMQALGTLGGNSTANAMSSDGTIVGSSEPTAGIPQPFIWTKARGLKPLGSVIDANALGVNSSGQVVGASQLFPYRPYLWDANTGAIQDLGTLGKEEGVASAINSIGQVAGFIDSDVFIWTQTGGMRNLGHLGEAVEYHMGINDVGQIVGGYYFGNGHGSCFIWSQSGGMRNLASMLDSSGKGWELDQATGINNAGQIVGVGIDPIGRDEAYLLTPLPEPSTLILLAIGGSALAARLRLKSRYRSDRGVS